MFRFIIVLIVNVFFTASVLSNEEATAAEKLSHKLSGTKTLTAEFAQTIRDSKGEILQQSTGKLMVKQPKNLYWHTQQPYEHVVVTNGETLWLYDIDLEQVNQEAYNESIDKAPALLLSGNIDAIKQNYAISLTSTAGDTGFVLKPLASGSAFAELRISFSNNQIKTMALQDNFDQETTILFSNIILNQTIPEQQFNFVVPEGVEIIKNDR